MNSVKCLQCEEILVSTYRHDFKMCSCENQTFCDGGNDYCRIGGVDINKIAVYDNETKEYVQRIKTLDSGAKETSDNE